METQQRLPFLAIEPYGYRDGIGLWRWNACLREFDRCDCPLPAEGRRMVER